MGWGPETFGYVFDRYVDPWVFRHGSIVQDKAHNQVIEELTTKGVVGTLAFSFMWLALVWAIIRRTRSAGEDALAYAILGALGAYFVQNLFLFDTPSALLVWLVLVGWVVTQEREEAVNSPDRDQSNWLRSGGIALPRIQRAVRTSLSSPWGRTAAVASLLLLLGVSLYSFGAYILHAGLYSNGVSRQALALLQVYNSHSFNLQPYLAARAFGQASQHGLPMSERLALAEKSFETFPAMANQPRQLMILQLVRLWDFFDDDTRHHVREFFGREASIALTSDPGNAPMLITAILFMQSTAQSPEALASLRPMLRHLEEIAPSRAETHQLLANQALKEGRYADALAITREYQSLAPDTTWFFAGIEKAALAGMDQALD